MAVVQQAIASINRPNNTGVTVTGGSTATLGIYTVRTFTATDTLVVSGGSLSCDYLVVGGGGKGGDGNSPSSPGGAGGGAEGGEVKTGFTTIAAGTYSVTIGGSQQDTTIGAILTAVKGNNGSDATGTGGAGGTGGPGANGGAGSGFSSGVGVNGTAGSVSAITGTISTYGGGGGGGGFYASPSQSGAPDRTAGIGGAGGGGAGGWVSSYSGNPYPGPEAATAGAANTGGGGGGGYGTGGAGGSGIVILRYVTP